MAVTSGPKPRRFTRDEYYRMGEAGLFREERVELLEGEVIAMSPQNTPHASTVARFNRLLFEGLGQGYEVRPQLPIHVDDWSEPEPDFAVCRLDSSRYLREHPQPEDILLLIEIADESLGYDTGRKRAAYARAGIRELWIVDLRGRRVLVCSQPNPASGAYELIRITTTGERLVLPSGQEIDVEAILPPASAGSNR